MARSQWWQSVRKAASAASQLYHGMFSGRDSTPMQRAIATGHTTGYAISNKFNELSHNTSWNWVATHAVGKQWAQAEYRVYDRSAQTVTKGHAQDAPDEQRKPVQDHPAMKLLKRPNPIMSHDAWMYQVANQLRLTGGWVIWEVRDKESGKPCELWVLPRAWLTMLPATEQFPMGIWRVINPRGLTGYWGNNRLAGGFWLDVRETIVGGWPHALYPGEPYSPLEACSQIIDIGEKADTATWASLVNSVRPGMILSVDPKVTLGPDQITAIEQKLRELKAGENNAGLTLVLQGVTKDSLGTPMADLDSTNVRKQSQEFMMGVQGVPGLIAGIRADVGTYSGDAATINTFVELGIQPDLDLFAASLTHRWQRYWGDDFEVELSAKRMDDPILKQKVTDQLFQGIDKGAVSVNEWRASLDLPPIPGGDEYEKEITHSLEAQKAQGGGLPPFLGDGQDLGDDLPDDEAPNQARPELQQAFDEMPAFLMNGSVH